MAYKNSVYMLINKSMWNNSRTSRQTNGMFEIQHEKYDIEKIISIINIGVKMTGQFG